MNVIFTPGLVTPFDGTFNLIYSKLLAAEHFKWTKWKERKKEEEEALAVATAADATAAERGRERESARRRNKKHYRVVEWNCFLLEFNSFAFICFLTDSPNLCFFSMLNAHWWRWWMLALKFSKTKNQNGRKKTQIHSIASFPSPKQHLSIVFHPFIWLSSFSVIYCHWNACTIFNQSTREKRAAAHLLSIK